MFKAFAIKVEMPTLLNSFDLLVIPCSDTLDGYPEKAIYVFLSLSENEFWISPKRSIEIRSLST